MKKYLLVGIAVATLGAMASHANGLHWWKLINKVEGYNGQTICEWVCNDLSGQHFTKTVGRGGRCPRP